LDRAKYPKKDIRTVTNYLTGKEDRAMFDRFVESVLEEKRQLLEKGREEGREEERYKVLELVKQGYTAEQIEAQLAAQTKGKRNGGSSHV
jgi:predicted transposase YdaD